VNILRTVVKAYFIVAYSGNEIKIFEELSGKFLDTSL
jgi:hypothetical protein